MDWRSASSTAREVVAEIRANNITFMAGSIAHSAFLSILPLLLLLLVITAAVGNEDLNRLIVDLSREHLSPTGEQLLFSALRDASDRGGTSVLGVASLLWGMLRVFRGLSTAFDELYGGGETGFLRQLAEGFVVFLVILVATVGIGLGATLFAFGDHPLARLLNPLVLVVGLTIAFYPMYYLLPEPDLDPREPIPGTLFAAIGWALLEAVFGLYVDLANTVTAFGLLGSVILLLVWLYGVAFVLLAGATVNLVAAGRHRSDPADGAADQASEDDPAADADDERSDQFPM